MKKIAGSLLLIFLLLLACDSKECSKDNQLIGVSLSEPYIEFYSKNGKKLREFNLSDSPYLKKRLAFAEQQCRQYPKKRESAYSLFRDAYLANDHLYLLYIDQDEKNQPDVDKVLVYTVESKCENRVIKNCGL